MNVIREAQEHHRNVELLEGIYICWSVHLFLLTEEPVCAAMAVRVFYFDFRKPSRNDADKLSINKKPTKAGGNRHVCQWQGLCLILAPGVIKDPDLMRVSNL